MKIQDIKKILWAANIVVAVVLVLSVIGAADREPTGGGDDVEPAPTSAQAQALTDEDVEFITDGGGIVRAGAQETSAQPQQSTTATEITTNFEYRLIGTAIHPERAFAFFEGPGGVTKVATVGDKVGDATLTEVRDDDAMLERGGRPFAVKREIRITQSTSTGQPQVASLTARAGNFPDFSGGPGSILQAPQNASGQQGEEESEESEEDAEEEEDAEDLDAMTMSDKQYKEYLENVGKYLSQIVILSHYGPDSVLDGLVLAKVPKESEAYKRGLREGDIIRSVQGVDITDTGTASKVAWEVYKNAEYYMEIGIIRNGEEEILSYEIWPDEE